MPRRKGKAAAKSKTPPPAAATKPKPKKVALPAVLTVVSSSGTTIDATIVTAGTDSLGRPVFMDPSSPHAVLNNLLVRDQLDPKEPLEPLSATVRNLQATVQAISRGDDIAPYRAHIQQVAANQPEKSDVVVGYTVQANQEYLADMVELRAGAVRQMKRAIRRNDISSSEAIVVWKIANEQIPTVTDEIVKHSKAVDTITVVEKIDFHRRQIEHSVQQKWEGTTPQGREIIRKKLWELKQQLNAARGICADGVEPPETLDDVPAEQPDAAPLPA